MQFRIITNRSSFEPTMSSLRDFKSGMIVEILDGNDVYCPVRINEVDFGKRLIHISYVGWGAEWDEEVHEKNFGRISIGNNYVVKARAWVNYANNKSIPKWPAIIYIRKPKPGSELGKSYLRYC